MNIGPIALEHAQWVETREDHHGPCVGVIHRTQWWLRRNPIARAWRGAFVTGGTGWSLDVVNEQGHFHTASSWKNCVVRDAAPHRLNSETLFWEVFVPRNAVRQTDGPNGGSHKLVSPANDQLELGLALRSYREKVESNFRTEETYWANPSIGRLLRRETREVDLASGQDTHVTVCDQYIYDVPAPPGTFEMPPGKPIEKSKHRNLMPEVWDSMAEAERQQIRGLIAILDHSWQAGDFQQFSSVWKFGEVAQAPGEEDWLKLVAAQCGTWSKWTKEVRSVRSVPFVSVRSGTSSFKLMGIEKARKTLKIGLELVVVHARNGRQWEGKSELSLWYMDPDESGRHALRIVHWDLPLAEIRSKLGL